MITPQMSADYWNKYLEHNAIRAPISGRGPDTDAGAFLAWMLEAAGDILRSYGEKPPGDTGYMWEKWHRLKNQLKDIDWQQSISPREQEDLEVIRLQIEVLPVGDQFTILVKELLTAIAYRFPTNINYSLDRLEPMIKALQPAQLGPIYPHVPQRKVVQYPHK